MFAARLASLHYDLQIPLTNDSAHLPAYGFEQTAINFEKDLGDDRLSIILAVPSCVAIFVLIGHIIVLLSPKRPLWMTNFVQEPKVLFSDAEQRRKQASPLLGGMVALSIVGLLFQIPTVVWPELNVQGALHVAPWLVGFGLIAVKCPRTAPVSLLPIYVCEFVVELLLITKWLPATDGGTPSTIFGLCTSFMIIVLILNMPLRLPELPTENIAKPFAQPTNQLRSPEDNLTVWQFMSVSWMSPLIATAAKRRLNDEDVWTLSYEFQHRLLHDQFRKIKGSVVGRLFKANGLDLMIITFLSIIETCADLSDPFLLQKLLATMGNPEAPLSASLTYAGLALVVRLIGLQSGVFNLWYGRRAYERSRGEMITMLHEKTLSRKVIGAGAIVEQDQPPQTTQNGGLDTDERSKNFLLRSWQYTRRLLSFRVFKKHEQRKIMSEAKEPASKGKILNLMRNDVYEVAQRFWEFSSIVTQPLVLILSIVLIWKLIGLPALAGCITVIIAQIFNAFIVRVLLRWERLRRTTTDTKLQKVAQVVESIRHLRWYGWQNSWLKVILQSRQTELKYRVITGLWGRLIGLTNLLASAMFPVAAFYAYTVIAGLPLRVDIAFPALELFSLLENSLRDIPQLITVLLNARIAVGRINDFMKEEDVSEGSNATEDGQQLQLRNASFAWPGQETSVLSDVTISFPKGMSVIFGKVGSGKTALLQALLGELDLLNGEFDRCNEAIGYCSQSPWLQNMSIRDNILFSAPYDEIRYKRVLEACALIPDLASFKHGDLSDIGENGIGLSGGQKARVALARAVYSQASILLLDDPISALDYQTSRKVVEDCLGGPLMTGRTVILVTHRTELCQHLAIQGIEVTEGKVKQNNEHTSPSAETSLSSTPELISDDKLDDDTGKNEEAAAVPEKFIEEEHRAHGGVKASVYWEYIKAGKLKFWSALVVILTIGRLTAIANSWFLKEWGEAYGETNIFGFSDFFKRFPPPETNPRPWLTVYLFIGLSRAFWLLMAQVFMVVIVYTAGRQMFQDIMYRVCYASFRFYDITPVGRLMNRMTSDINTIDGDISNQFQTVVFQAISWVSSMVVIASIAPVFLIFSALLTVSFIMIFVRFLPTSQSLRRLEMVSLSPLMSNFGALLDGLVTIRAFRAQYRFQDRVIKVTDSFQKMDHFYWGNQAWLMYRFDALSSASSFFLTLLALYTGLSPGLTAFLLIAASKFVNSTHRLCKQYGKLQMNFVSVERIVELLEIEQEPPGQLKPPASWPTFTGDVTFDNVTVRYAETDSPALENVSFKIKGGSTTAIVGRTGSGKSTLALSLLATISPESGQIFIDGIDISEVDKQALRSRVTFLAQDPVLFPGTMRQNLDPLEEHSDEECESVLHRIGDYQWTLETHIDTGGKNLSQGQRQLVCLARAVLRRSAVVIFDEATASIDQKTSVEIQHILREELAESTVIAIAHRLEAVVNADYCIELSHGRVARHGNAAELLQGSTTR